MNLINLGCGPRFHPDWTNIDFNSSSPHVQAHDLRQGIPCPDETFDVVYHSHLLEHFPRHKALGFIQGCYRVLKPRGIIRVVVPDLERIVKMYLQALNRALDGEDGWQHNYEWMMLELYDQTVREHPGGAMLEYLKQDPIPNEAFVYERIGGEALRIVRALRSAPIPQQCRRPDVCGLIRRIQHLFTSIRVGFIRKLLGEHDYKALQIGRFRLRGEVHQWMYDRYSLSRLLQQAGFENPVQQTAFGSAVENWGQFNLDAEPDGTVYKPDSLYMEAVKPTI